VSYVELSTVDAMKRWWVPAAALAVLVMVGCSKEEPTQPSQPKEEPTQPKNYMPLAVGNWWVYSRVQLDTNGNVKPGMEWRDSTVVVGTVRIAGKTAYALVSYINGQAVDTTYMALEGNKLYIYLDTSRMFESPFRLFGPWMLMVDFSGQSWSTQAQDSVRVDNVDFFEYTGTFIAVARLSGRRVGSEAVQIRERGQTVQAEKFELKLSLIGNFEAQGIRFPVQHEIPVAMWFAENIGQVAYRIGPESVNVQPPPPLPPQQIKVEDGAARVLLNYQVR
jgi:hypothetical protein